MKFSRSVKFGCLLPVGLVGFFIVGVMIYDGVAPSNAKKALPDSAIEIQEFYRETGFMAQDFTRCLKAKMPKSDFPEYAKRLHLTHSYTRGEKVESLARLDSRSGMAPDWFDPPPADEAEGVYYDSGPSWVRVLKYKEPYVYFFVIDW